MTHIVILAAGKGTRMCSNLPKVLHPIGGKPMIMHVLDAGKSLGPSSTTIIVGHGAEQVEKTVVERCASSEGLQFVTQTAQLGTGHAVAQALPIINDSETVLILYGDVPLIEADTLKKLDAACTPSSLGLLTIYMDKADGYGRIVRDAKQNIEAIVEQKDALPEQLLINEVNTGMMAVSGACLHRWLPKIDNKNAQQEYYLTDIIAMAKADGIRIVSCQPNGDSEVAGVNDRRQQAQLERAYQQKRAHTFMSKGLSLLDPDRFDCRGELTHGNDCEIDINCIIEGKNTLGNNITIGPNCHIKNTKIGDSTVILANSVIEGASIGNGCHIGPFARIRPGTELKNKAKIGNFVETKKSVVGNNSKINHLSYIGDAVLGDNVNIGAGTITCNYDGVNKSQTVIEEGAFIGSNSALVAPVKVGKNATVGAGTVVTRDSSEDQLVIARTKQKNMDGWERPTKKT